MPSLKHQFLARAVPRIRRAGEVEDPEQVRAEKLAAQATAATDPPASVLAGFDVRAVAGPDFDVHDLRVAGTEPPRSIVYLHGGGYVQHADEVHWKYVATLARRLGARIVLPVYPLAPTHTWRDSHAQLLDLVEQVAIASPHGVALAGDSAGGGYALALAQQLAARPGPQPTHLLLHSPWVDLTGQTPGTEQAAARDPWLTVSRLRLYADWWSGGDDPARPELSPLHGDLSGLPPTLVFCGTLDILFPQCRLLAERAAAQGTDLRYVEEPDLLHVYPLLPVPEAKPALATALEFLG